MIGDGAIIASGSTITQDVPALALAVARGRQVNKENYVANKELMAEASESKSDSQILTAVPNANKN